MYQNVRMSIAARKLLAKVTAAAAEGETAFTYEGVESRIIAHCINAARDKNIEAEIGSFSDQALISAVLTPAETRNLQLISTMAHNDISTVIIEGLKDVAEVQKDFQYMKENLKQIAEDAAKGYKFAGINLTVYREDADRDLLTVALAADNPILSETVLSTPNMLEDMESSAVMNMHQYDGNQFVLANDVKQLAALSEVCLRTGYSYNMAASIMYMHSTGFEDETATPVVP